MGDGEEIVLGSESFDFSPDNPDTFELDVLDFREQPGLEYPAVLLSNVLFTDCLKVLQAVKRESYREFPLWIEMPDGDGFSNVGTLQIDSDTLLLLRHLRIGVTIYFDSDTVESLDLDDPEVLERYV